MKSFNDFLKINLENRITELETKMNTSIKKSYYQEIFETYFDISDANSFIVEDSFGAWVKYMKCQNNNIFKNKNRKECHYCSFLFLLVSLNKFAFYVNLNL